MKDPATYENKAFSRLLIQFITQVNEENKKNHTELEYLSLIVTESLIYNLFRSNSKN
jgi:hypothetical protein